MSQARLSDIEKWTAFKNGEERAISLIYTEQVEKLYHYGLKFTSESAIIEGSIQDIFADLIKNRKTIGHTDNITFYLMKSFKRKLLRKIATKNMYVSDDQIPEYEFNVIWSIEHDIILKEVSEQKITLLKDALKQLTSRQKEAIYLRYTKEMNYKEVSEIMGISVEACRNLISNAITSLKEWFSDKAIGHTLFFMLFAEKRPLV